MVRRWRMLACLAVVGSGGVATADEIESTGDTLARYVLAPNFETLDCGNEGHVDSSEVDEHFPALFNRHDRNLDRVVTRAEYVRARAEADRAIEAELFETLDSDGNAEVSTLEYRAGMIKLIRTLDRDGDGEITRAEMGETVAKR
ncbi:MAG: hypothetical protein AAFX58_02485 [Pseudomonadota bacterium]